MRVRLEALVGVQLLRDRLIRFNRQQQTHLSSFSGAEAITRSSASEHELEDRLAGLVEQRSLTAERSSQVLCQQSYGHAIRSIDGTSRAEERRVVVGDRAADAVRERGAGADRRRSAPQLAPRARGPSSPRAGSAGPWRPRSRAGSARGARPRGARHRPSSHGSPSRRRGGCRRSPPRRRTGRSAAPARPRGRSSARRPRASSSTAAVPPAPSLAPTNPGMSLVS